MQSKLTSVPEFLKSLPEDRRKALTRLRTQVRAELPALKESMRYGMPGYEDSTGTMRVAFNSQRQYMALYICNAEILKARQQELDGLDCGKSCIRFQRLEQLPAKTVSALLRDIARLIRKGGAPALMLLALLALGRGAIAGEIARSPARPAAVTGGGSQ